MFVFVRDICPETDSFCIFYNHAFIKEKVRLCITTCRDTRCGNWVHFYSHRTITVMYLSVFCCCKTQMLIETCIIAVNVSNIPFGNIRFGFKGKQNFGTFTKVKGCCSCKCFIVHKSCCKCTCKICRSIFCLY